MDTEPVLPVEVWCDGVQRLLSDGSDFSLLSYSNHSAGLLVRNAGDVWLLAEDSIYMPDQKPIQQLSPELGAPAFRTDGTQWFVDLSARRFLESDFSATEGGIQGLVYAVDAMDPDNRASTEMYKDYLQQLLAAIIRAEGDWSERLLPKHIKRLRAFIGNIVLSPELQS